MKYNQFLKECLSKATAAKSKNATGDTAAKSVNQDKSAGRQTGNRKKIGLLDTEPKRIGHTPEGLTPHQQDLREAVINRFKFNKVNRYITEQVSHINYKEQLAEGIRLLFDEHGRTPANVPLEDIIAAREKIESEIRMLEAICFAMRHHLSKIKEIEEMALASIEEVDQE